MIAGITFGDLAAVVCAGGLLCGILLLAVWALLDCWRVRRGEAAQRRIRAAGLLSKKLRAEERR